MSLLADNMILYIENPKDFTKNLLDLSTNSVKLQDTINMQKLVAFLYTNNKLSEKIILKSYL